MTAEKIAIRRPLWIAMSDLFLDTDVSLFYEHVARVCADSPFTLEELDDIFQKEVAPVVGPNLLSSRANGPGSTRNGSCRAFSSGSNGSGRFRGPTWLLVTGRPCRNWSRL